MSNIDQVVKSLTLRSFHYVDLHWRKGFTINDNTNYVSDKKIKYMCDNPVSKV